MAEPFSIPEEYALSFRRLLPYLTAPLQNDPDVHASVMLYLKLGGEKLARAAIDAFNVSRKLEDVELIRLLREEALRNDLQEVENEDEDQDADDDAEVDEGTDGDTKS